MYNPDYPVSAGAGFIQHTYQPQQTNQTTYFYGGNTCTNPFEMYGGQPDSRRNQYGAFPTPTNPTYPQPVQQATQEQAVMPYSSYPSNVPTNNAAPQMGFNALVESRRNAAAVTNQQNAANPWNNTNAATASTSPYPYQTMSTPTMAPTMMPQQSPYGMMPQNPYGYGYGVEQASYDLYVNNNPLGFDKKNGCWENCYTQPRTIPVPNIQWNQPVNLNPMGTQPNPAYPISSYPKTNMSWKEIAERNWGSTI
jgi:hypothetical protein